MNFNIFFLHFKSPWGPYVSFDSVLKMATGERANLSLGGTSSLGSYYCSGGALSYSVPLLSKVMTGAVFMNQFFFYLLRCASVYLVVVSTCASIYNIYIYLNKYIVMYWNCNLFDFSYVYKEFWFFLKILFTF